VPLSQRSDPTARTLAARCDTQSPQSRLLDAHSPEELQYCPVDGPLPSQHHSTYITRKAAGNALQRALPKPECRSDSGGLQLFSAKCGNWRAPVPARADAADFVKSIAIRGLESDLAQVHGLRLAKMRKNTRFQTPTTQNRFLNGINNIRRKVAARPELLCPLASTNRGLGPKLKLPQLSFSKQARLSHAESIAYAVSGGKLRFRETRNCVVSQFGL
jgi:hypothetical protein